MFSNSDFEMIGFNPCPETARPVSDFSSQTISKETISQETQTGSKQSATTQAVPKGKKTKSSEKPGSYDPDKLLKFLKRVVPHLEKELKGGVTLLKSSQDDNNFDQYSQNDYVDAQDDDDFDFDEFAFLKKTKEECEPKKVEIKSNDPEDKVVSDLSLDYFGVHLAVSYSEKEHEGWCCHESSVEVYNVEFNELKQTLKASSCVRCITFYPDCPSLLAAGLHNGDVIIWRFSMDPAPLTKVKGNSKTEAHSDAVSFLGWMESEDRVKKSFISGGRDGKIIFWKASSQDMTYEAHNRFLISSSHISSSINSSSGYLEILGVSFWFQKKFEFVVAALGGAIFHCSTRTAKSLPSSPDYKDPVHMSYEPHKGIVTGICCLQETDLFASCGTDNEIHIYKSEVVAPLYVLHVEYPLLGIDWTNKTSLLSWGRSPKVELHKISIKGGRHFSSKLVEVESEISRLVVKPQRDGYIALVKETGEIMVIKDLPF